MPEWLAVIIASALSGSAGAAVTALVGARAERRRRADRDAVDAAERARRDAVDAADRARLEGVLTTRLDGLDDSVRGVGRQIGRVGDDVSAVRERVAGVEGVVHLLLGKQEKDQGR